jgi:predicted negative regulator of RcsB-dependent stress response
MVRHHAVSSESGEDATESFVEWMQLHAREVAIGAATVAVLFAGVVGYRWYERSANQKAETALYQAQLVSQNGNPRTADSALGSVAKRFSGTPAGAQATILMAKSLYDQNKYSEGLALLEQIKTGDDLTRHSADLLMAAGLEQTGKAAEAAKKYEDAAKTATGKIESQNLQASAARAYTAANNTEAAKKIWTELAAEIDSPVAGEAKVRLGEIEARIKS